MEWKKLSEKQKTGKSAADPQTGEVYELETEAAWDIVAATISVVYLITMLVLFVWQLVDVCTGRLVLLKVILHDNAEQLNSDINRIIAYAVIGGGLGGIVNGFRSILHWHADRKAFGWRHLWKYITLPFLGATLAAIVYALSRGGIAVIGGNSTVGNDSTVQAFSAFAIGALSGYGAQKVFKWLDEHVNRLFQISVEVPELKARTKQEATDILRASELNLGTVSEQASTNAEEINKVIDQSPPAGTKKPKASPVDITIGKKE